MYAKAFLVAYQPIGYADDDVGLIATYLKCYQGGFYRSAVGAGQGHPGQTQSESTVCNRGNYINAVRLLSQPYSSDIDNTATNNVQMRCTDGKVLSATSTTLGDWLDWVQCPKGEVIAGINVAMQDPGIHFPIGDKTSVNQLKFKCEQLQWGSWGAWTGCSKSCGGGDSYRYRSCPVKDFCTGGHAASFQQKTCNSQISCDPCKDGTQDCDANAICANKDKGLFTCTCKTGYSGDGKTCVNIDECANGTHDCSEDATCTNDPIGSFTCTCKDGFSGDGHKCVRNYRKEPRKEKQTNETDGQLKCFTCNARSVKDCKATGSLKTCQENEQSCELEVRTRFNQQTKVYDEIRVITGCKQPLACKNNHAQNFVGKNKNNTQCRPEKDKGYDHSVCRQCCWEDNCVEKGGNFWNPQTRWQWAQKKGRNGI